MQGFDPWLHGAQGGLLIGAAAALLLLANGRIAGISGILGGLLLERPKASGSWRWLFVIGLMLGGALYKWIFSDKVPTVLPVGPALMCLAGLLVGFGTRLGSGCTSGHGVCGLARLSRRSLVATLVFMIFGILTVFVLRHVWRWS